MYQKRMPPRNRGGAPRPRGTGPTTANISSRLTPRSGPIDHGTVGAIRIIPLGGVEEIGKNMTVIEYGNDIVIVDAGFQFPGDEAPGVDYIIPDVTYLAERKEKIRGLIITHGHLDHTGGIPYIMERIGNPPLYCRKITAALIKKRQDEFPYLPRLDMRLIEKEEVLSFGALKARFFAVTHTIPDAMGVIIETPIGNIVHTGDLKVDHQDGVPLASEEEIFGAIGKGNNLLLMSDSTNVERPGFSYSERAVHENLREIIKGARGRLIIGTFASLLERIIFIIKTAEELGKKIVIEGRSMRVNVEIAKELGYLKAAKYTIIPGEEMDNHPAKDIIVLATGAQGDTYAALMRMANRQHKTVKINKTDVIILSSSIIPGNEKTVQKLKDNLSRQGAKILHYSIADVHSSGHAYHQEALWIIKKINPRFFIPVHGWHHMLRVHAEVAREAGLAEENIVIPDNGMIIEISPDGKTIAPTKKTAPSGIVMIDGLGKGDVKEVVVRDRQVLAQDGMFVIVAVIDVKTGKIRKSPDIISRGFIYLKESQDLLNQTRLLVKKSVEESVGGMHPINFDYIKNNVREKVGRFLFQETSKRPIIIPVLLEV
jgi:ribonuclease J